MGRVLTRIVSETPGAELVGGLEPRGSPAIGADMGELAGLGPLDLPVSDDPQTLLTRVDGIIDFTVPAATLSLVELSAQADVRVDDSDQCQVGEMIALGDQLGADDDVDRSCLHLRDDLGGLFGRP